MTASLQQQADELLLTGQERAAHIEILERNNAEGRRHQTPAEVLALKRLRLETLRRAYATLRDLAEREEPACPTPTPAASPTKSVLG